MSPDRSIAALTATGRFPARRRSACCSLPAPEPRRSRATAGTGAQGIANPKPNRCIAGAARAPAEHKEKSHVPATRSQAAEPKREAANTDRVFIFDTTLRDGEQCPGATMTFEEKLEVAEFLDDMGVDIIEAGFPIASEGDFEAVSEIARRVKSAVVCGLSRAGEADIDRAGEAVKHARRPRIHTFISTSPVHLKHKLQKSAEQVLEMVHFQVTRARNWVEDVEWSAEDATRTEIDYLVPLRGDGHQGRRHHHQPARHGGLRHARGILRRCSAP